MKKVLFFTLILFSGSAILNAITPEDITNQIQSTKSTQHVVSSDEQFANLHELCSKQYTLFYRELLHSLNMLDTHINWWKSEQAHSTRSSLTQSPRFWFKPMHYEDRIVHCLFRLKIKHKELAHNLGKLNELMGELKTISTLKDLKLHIATHSSFIPDAIGGTIKHPNPSHRSYVPLAQNMISTIEQLKLYSKKLSFELKDIKRVNHIERNWIKYLATSIAIIGTGYYVSKNYDEIQTQVTELYQNTKDGIYNFWQTHVHEAFTNARDAIFKPKINLENRQEDINSGIRQLKNILDKYHPNLEEKEVIKILDQYRHTLVIPSQIVTEINDLEENPVTSFFNPLNFNKFKNIGLFWAHTKKIKIEDMEQQIDILLRIALITPSLILGKLALDGTGKASNIFKRTQIYTPIKRYLLKMERKLNAQSNKLEKTNYTDQGLMVYWGHELRKIISLVPKEERYDFIKDIKEIERSDFTTQQKISTIKRMYRTYEFLYPVTA